jgi:hypothetical protein
MPGNPSIRGDRFATAAYRGRVSRSLSKRTSAGAWALLAVVAGALVPAAPAAVAPVALASAYCSAIPIVEVEKEAWGFHAGAPTPGSRTSYARGHGRVNLSTLTASGVICQADRAADAPERQMILTIEHKVIYASHDAVMFGVPGNVIKLGVRVRSTTDSACPVGTRGEVTIFASYNGVHRDSVEFAFRAACADHRRAYAGGDVVTNVPPN